jgi:uncharacterized protein (DUF2147 family)
MKRFFCLAILTLLGSPAYASSYSFVVAGHAIHIEAPRHCRSASCVSVSIPGVYETRSKRDRHDDEAPAVVAALVRPVEQAVAPAASKPAAQPEPVTAAPPPPAVSRPTAVIAPAPVAPPATIQPSNTLVAPVPAPPPALVSPAPVAPAPPPATQPSTTPPAAPSERPAEAVRPPAKILKASDEVDTETAETPLGDWRIEGKNRSVRIEQCGPGLCGYVLNAASDAKEEPVLINMKPHGAKVWSGDIYSRDSGDTFNGTIAMRGSNALKVEACAFGRFFCSASVWRRIAAAPEVTTSQTSSPPRT